MSCGRLWCCLNKLELCVARVCRMDCVRDMVDIFVVANEMRCLLYGSMRRLAKRGLDALLGMGVRMRRTLAAKNVSSVRGCQVVGLGFNAQWSQRKTVMRRRVW
jgi:hypothetical protein